MIEKFNIKKYEEENRLIQMYNDLEILKSYTPNKLVLYHSGIDLEYWSKFRLEGRLSFET
jgi:hypothetical protein